MNSPGTGFLLDTHGITNSRYHADGAMGANLAVEDYLEHPNPHQLEVAYGVVPAVSPPGPEAQTHESTGDMSFSFLVKKR